MVYRGLLLFRPQRLLSPQEKFFCTPLEDIQLRRDRQIELVSILYSDVLGQS